LASSTRRLDSVRASFQDKRLDALLVSDLLNVRYLSGFTGSSGLVLVTRRSPVFFTDSRYTIQAGRECRGCKVVQIKKGLLTDAVSYALGVRAKRIGFESDHVTYKVHSDLAKLVSGKGARLVPTTGITAQARKIKDTAEIRAITRAVELTDRLFGRVLRWLKVGVTEQEVALKMEFWVRERGGKLAFPSIVASGPQGALPHAQPGKRAIKKGDFVTLDFGAMVAGYAADLTRTVCIGRADKRQKRVYETVLAAQTAAIEAMKPGIAGKAIDKIARDIITKAGYGKRFGHGLGHGIGLNVHDPGSLSARSEDTLQPGMVLTVEPGIYIPRWGGVRIEDDVLVTKTGHRVLTQSPKELIEL
jgi:Xaa-Pro aminopeptidase